MAYQRFDDSTYAKVTQLDYLSVAVAVKTLPSIVLLDLNSKFAAQKRKVTHQRVRARMMRYSDTCK